MKLGMIGATGSSVDIRILDSFLAALPPSHLEDVDPDMVDLSRGRDFLTESKTYDAVCLFMIFRFRPEELRIDELKNARLFGDHLFLTSPHHYPDKWRERLVATNAKYVFVAGFNDHAEIGSDYLGDLPGYTMRRISDGDVLYVKGSEPCRQLTRTS